MKDMDPLERIQRRATKTVPELRDLSKKERLKGFNNTTEQEVNIRSNRILLRY